MTAHRHPTPLPDEPPAPRRQARGRRRIEEILDAAGLVFAEVGYAAATTNAIAARAGISPGSLYQYFPNKEAIAAALEVRYAGRIRDARASAASTPRGDSAGDAIDDLVDAVVTFAVAAPGFGALFAGRTMSADVAHSTHDLHQAIAARVGSIIDLADGSLDPAVRRRRTLVAVQLCRAITPLIAVAPEPERELLAGELRRVLGGYLGAPG